MNKKVFKDVEIFDYGFDGEGVCKIDGKICFVPYVIKNEIIDLKIIKENSKFMFGEILNFKRTASTREKPLCPYFSVCGGCAYQHINYINELEIKKMLLSRQLQKLDYNGIVNIYPSEKEYFYRNKIKLFVGEEKIGLKKRASNEIIDIENCCLVDGLINKAIPIIKVFFTENNLFNLFNTVLLRQENNQCLILFEMKKYKKVDFLKLEKSLGNNYGLFLKYKNQYFHQFGFKILQSEEFGLKINFNIDSFHQVNKFVMNNLYKKVLDSLYGKKVLNCYSGAGVLSGVIAKKGFQVDGIELGINEHLNAQYLKKANHLSNLKNINGDCVNLINNYISLVDTIIVDPPKAGMNKKVVECINISKSKRIIYVSCEVATLVRDVKYLSNYHIIEISLFDMFARTGEYEVVAILDLNK